MTFNQVIRALAQEGQYIDPSKRAGEPSDVREHRLFEGDQINRVPPELDVHRSNLDVITWRNAQESERSDHFGLIAPKNSKAKQTPYGADKIYGDNINRNRLMRRGSYNPAQAFQTTTQVENMHGIGKDGAPLTTLDIKRRIVVCSRNKVYRRSTTGAGNVSVSEFELMLQRIGVEIPDGVKWLLTKYKANGDAKFKEFVRAFGRAETPRSTCHRQQQAARPRHGRASDDGNDSVRRTMRASMNVTSAGDIISWVGADAAKTDESLTGDGFTTIHCTRPRKIFSTGITSPRNPIARILPPLQHGSTTTRLISSRGQMPPPRLATSKCQRGASPGQIREYHLALLWTKIPTMEETQVYETTIASNA